MLYSVSLTPDASQFSVPQLGYLGLPKDRHLRFHSVAAVCQNPILDSGCLLGLPNTRFRFESPDPLLAKQVGKNTKCFCWCRLHGKPTKFPFFSCLEVVPKN